MIVKRRGWTNEDVDDVAGNIKKSRLFNVISMERIEFLLYYIHVRLDCCSAFWFNEICNSNHEG